MIPYDRLVAEVLDLEPQEVDDAVSPGTHDGWTSLKHQQLVVAIEENYGVRLTNAQIQSMTSLGVVRRLLLEAGVTA